VVEVVRIVERVIESDLAAYDAYYGLPACTTANGCFRKVDQNGGTHYPSRTDWHLEIALDVETAHQTCQNCKILLVEATDNYLSDLGAAVNRAVAMGANVVSNSYGAGEYPSETSDEAAYSKEIGRICGRLKPGRCIRHRLPRSYTCVVKMSTSLVTSTRLDAWVGFLRSHAAITRQLNVDLLDAHGLTINDYEVLIHLAGAEDGMMRRVDLAESVLLTASGITRLLDGLERAGYVEKARCDSDARVSYAKLTGEGRAMLVEASQTHLAGIEELFTSRFSGDELETLGALLGRLPMTDKACSTE
jgi:DNA-binding MarR family transcriptional regulator